MSVPTTSINAEILGPIADWLLRREKPDPIASVTVRQTFLRCSLNKQFAFRTGRRGRLERLRLRMGLHHGLDGTEIYGHLELPVWGHCYRPPEDLFRIDINGPGVLDQIAAVLRTHFNVRLPKEGE